MNEATVAGVRTAPLVWSVRRELWEHRSIYLAPAAVAALMVLGGFINTDRLRDKLGKISLLPAADQSLALATPFEIVAAGLFVTGLIVAVIYCMDALYAERRDRSVLFWKSLPVSDATAVAAKMLVPLLVIPAVVLVLTLAVQLVIFLTEGFVFAPAGVNTAALRANLPLAHVDLSLVFGMIAAGLWYAPLYAWILLVSAWARRTPALWVLLPPLALMLCERIALQSHHFASLLGWRLHGFATLAFNLDRMHEPPKGVDAIPEIVASPGTFFASPSLWLGLAAAIVITYTAIRMRRHQGPI